MSTLIRLGGFTGGGGGGGVSSINSITGAIELIAGSNITLTPAGNNITIASTGGITFPLEAPNGSASAPSFAFGTGSAGAGTGLYGFGTNELGFATNGLSAGFIDTNQAWNLTGAIISTSSIQIKINKTSNNYSIL
jgi:hypothetical protein